MLEGPRARDKLEKHLGQDPAHQEKLVQIFHFLALVGPVGCGSSSRHLELFHCLCTAALVTPATDQELKCPPEEDPPCWVPEKKG